jgi:hypothetical protein
MPPLTDEGFTEEDSIMNGHEVLGIESVQEREGTRRTLTFTIPDFHLTYSV